MCSLSYVHVFRIEYVSYRQGPYRIRIVSAADRIVPALLSGVLVSRLSLLKGNKIILAQLICYAFVLEYCYSSFNLYVFFTF